MNAHGSKIRCRPRDTGSQFATNVRPRFLCIASLPHQKMPRRPREKVQSAPLQNDSEAGASCLISPMHSACIPWPPLFLPIKNPLSCWNAEEQDRGMSHFLGKWGGAIWIREMLSHSFDTVTVDQAPVTRDQIFACSPAVTPKRIAFMTEAVISCTSKK